MSIDETIKMSDMWKVITDEIYHLIDAMTKAEVNFSKEKRFFSSDVRSFNRFEILRKANEYL